MLAPMAPSEGKRLRSPTREDFLCRPWQEERSESSHSSLRAPFLGGAVLHPGSFLLSIPGSFLQVCFSEGAVPSASSRGAEGTGGASREQVPARNDEWKRQRC